MASQNFSYTKISELPSASELANADLFVVNHNGTTSKMTWQQLMGIIDANVTHDLSALTARVSALETAESQLANTVSDLASRVTDLEGTVNNIITAGFNLIGVDTTPQNNG